jgi:ABC-type sugar transport system permease subunit
MARPPTPPTSPSRRGDRVNQDRTAVYPLLQQLYGSFLSWYQFRPSSFTGLANYSRLLDDPIARLAALHTVIYVLGTVLWKPSLSSQQALQSRHHGISLGGGDD